MGETELSKQIAEMVRREFPEFRLTRHQCGIILAKGGRRVHCGDPGWPDRIGYAPDGRWLSIEVKAPSAKPRKDQENQRQRGEDIKTCGGYHLTVSDPDDCRKQLTWILIHIENEKEEK